jgi:hypothetical protein
MLYPVSSFSFPSSSSSSSLDGLAATDFLLLFIFVSSAMGLRLLRLDDPFRRGPVSRPPDVFCGVNMGAPVMGCGRATLAGVRGVIGVFMYDMVMADAGVGGPEPSRIARAEGLK